MTERKEGNRRRSTETEEADIAITLSVAEETNASSADDNKACSNRRSREDECDSSKRFRVSNRNSSEKGSLCYEGRQRKKLLCLWKFQVHGPLL